MTKLNHLRYLSQTFENNPTSEPETSSPPNFQSELNTLNLTRQDPHPGDYQRCDLPFQQEDLWSPVNNPRLPNKAKYVFTARQTHPKKEGLTR